MPKKCWRDLSIPSVSENREGKEKELWEGQRELVKEAGRDDYMKEAVSPFASVTRKLRLNGITTVIQE